MYNVFISKRVNNKETNLDDIHFEIKKDKSRLKSNNETFHDKTELNNLTQKGSGNVRVCKGRGTNSAGDISKRNLSQLDQNFLLSNDNDKKKQ